MMDAITKIDISNPSFCIHGLRTAGSLSAISMRSFICRSGISLCFYNNPCCFLAIKMSNETRTQEFLSKLHNIFSQIERLLQFIYHLYKVSLSGVQIKTDLFYLVLKNRK